MKKDSILYLLSSDKSNNTMDIYDLSRSDLNSLLYRSDLLETDSHGMNVLMHALISNDYKNLNLNTQQWDYLIKNSDLKQMSQSCMTALYIYARVHREEKIVLSKDQQNYLFDHSNLPEVFLKCDQVSLLDIVFMNKENVNNLFTTERIDYLVDNFQLTNTMLCPSDVKSEIKKTYNEYCIEREKRVLSSTLQMPSLPQKSETFKL